MTLQFSHANGFPAQSYQALFDALAPHAVSYVPMFGHGDYDFSQGWQPMVQELVSDIEAKQIAPVVGIGHSLGGVLTLFAAMQRPDLFSQIILLDPPIFGGWKRGAMRMLKTIGLLEYVMTPARRSKSRRDIFPNPETAYEYWRNRSLFKRFDERSMRLYIEHGLHRRPDGNWHLTFRREREYAIFMHTPIVLGNTRALQVPGYFIRASDSPLLNTADMAWLQKNLPALTFLTFEGSHMFPLETPALLGEYVKKLLA